MKNTMYMFAVTFLINTKMASFAPLAAGFTTQAPTSTTQSHGNQSLKLVLGNCTVLLQYTTLNMNQTFNYVCEHWCTTYSQPVDSCCSAVHTLAATNDVADDEDEASISYEERLDEIYSTVNKYRHIIQNLTVGAERSLCQIHWSRGLQCVYPRNCATTNDTKERTFCYFQTVKLNMDSLQSLLKDAIALLNRTLPMTSSTPTEEPGSELVSGLNDLLNLSHAVRAIQEVTSSLNSLQSRN